MELDLRTDELFWTRETCRIHELDTFETPGLQEAFDFFCPEAQTQLRVAVTRAIETGEPWDMELPFTTAKGNSLWVRTQGIVVHENGRPIKLQGAFQDITQRKQAEADRALLESQLRQSQKMEAIGTLAGGVAHDFNNILAVIIGNAELALNSVDSPVMTLYCLREIEKASNRARDLVRQIMSFGRPHATDKKIIALIDVVDESIRLLRATLPARVSLTVEASHDVPAILADTTQIQQVIINLVTNAYQAFAGGSGSIEIQVDCVTLSKGLVAKFPQLEQLAKRSMQLVRLSVTDDGPGIDPAIRERLFEPFFTTKAVGEGTGLGLSVVHGIVRTHDGAVTVESEPAKVHALLSTSLFVKPKKPLHALIGKTQDRMAEILFNLANRNAAFGESSMLTMIVTCCSRSAICSLYAASKSMVSPISCLQSKPFVTPHRDTILC